MGSAIRLIAELGVVTNPKLTEEQIENLYPIIEECTSMGDDLSDAFYEFLQNKQSGRDLVVELFNLRNDLNSRIEQIDSIITEARNNKW